jgi:hypothetical protein
MIKKIFSLFLIFFLFYGNINAQKSAKAISIELGKTGVIFNLNYDQKFSKFGFRIGAGSNFNKYLKAITFGGGGFYLLGTKNSFFEFGTELHYLAVEEFSDDQKSFTLIFPDYETKTFLANINIGYRLYSSKTLFRVGVSPCITKNEFIPGGYLSIGLTL